MRHAVGLLLVVVVLAGCGNKGSLYHPTPERDQQQQNSKTTPRQ